MILQWRSQNLPKGLKNSYTAQKTATETKTATEGPVYENDLRTQREVKIW